MALENKLSVQLAPAAATAIATAIQTIQTNLPFLLNLTADERKELPKMGDKTVAFVNKALEYAKQNPQVVPAFMNVPEFAKDVDLVNALTKIAFPLSQLSEKLDDTTMEAGSEAFSAALVFYNAVKAAAKAGVPGMKVVADDLQARFPRRTAAKPELAEN